MQKHRIHTSSFSSVYPHYIAKAEKKGRIKAEVDEVIRRLTGYSQTELAAPPDSLVLFLIFWQPDDPELALCPGQIPYSSTNAGPAGRPSIWAPDCLSATGERLATLAGITACFMAWLSC